MALHRGYEPATGPASGPTPGAKALMSWFLGAYGDRGAANLGIFNPKRLGSGWSLHAEGRAGDLGTKPYNNPGGDWPKWGQALANKLVANSKELGVQLVIFRGRIWSGSHPDAGWRDYNGTNPHDGHIHTELSKAAAKTLTAAKVQKILGGTSKPKPKPAPKPARTGTESIVRNLPQLQVRKPMMVGFHVWLAQQALNRLFGAGLRTDGWYGKKTAEAVKVAQRKAGIGVDGIVGTGQTWPVLLSVD